MLQFRPEVSPIPPGQLPSETDQPKAAPFKADAEVFEFGPFRLDAATPALYLEDDFVALTPKALETLCVLVEGAGRLVTKDEILQRVWPDAFVEEGSIANNISALRKALNPCFEGVGPIATIARRGYRFTAPVQLRKMQPQIVLIADSVKHAKPIAAIRATVETRSPVETRSAVAVSAMPHRADAAEADQFKRTALAAIMVAVIVGVIGFAAVMQVSAINQSAAPVIRRSVAVLPMKNLSGEAAHNWLRLALAETISAELAGGNQFRVVSGENVVRMQQELAPPAGVGLTRKQLDEIGRDLGSDLILTGNYLVVGGKMRIDVRLDEVATGDAIASASITDTSDRFLDIVARAGAELRLALGVDPQPAGYATAVRAAFAAGPDALRNYFEGLEALRLRDGPKARELLTAAVGVDGNFALAHAALSTTWRLLGYDKRGAGAAQRALDLSGQLSSEGRASVEAQFHEATASWPKAIALYQALWKQYPDNIEYGLKLGNAQWLGGRSADTLTTIAELRAMPERDSRDSRIDLLEASAADTLNDYPRASAAAARAADKAKAANAKLMLARARTKQGIYALRVGKRDEAMAYLVEAESLFAALGEIGGVADVVRWQGSAAFDAGRYDDAAAAHERALKMVAPLNYVRLATELQLNLADVARLRGDLGRAITLAESALASAREADHQSAQARALITLATPLRLRGDLAGARDAYQRAAEMLGAIGEVRNQNIALNNIAVIDFLTGDLPRARQSFETVLAYDRKIGNNAGLALRLNNISRIRVLQDELAEAEQLNAEECRLQESLKAVANLAWCRTRLADIYLERGRRDDAQALAAPIVVKDFGSSVMAPIYLARFARLQLGLGHVDAAAIAIAAAEKVQAAGAVVEEQAIHVAVIRAEVEAAQGKRTAAIARLTRAISDADRSGLTTWWLDARLVLSRLDPREAAETERAARHAGFTLMARKARALAVKSS